MFGIIKDTQPATTVEMTENEIMYSNIFLNSSDIDEEPVDVTIHNNNSGTNKLLTNDFNLFKPTMSGGSDSTSMCNDDLPNEINIKKEPTKSILISQESLKNIDPNDPYVIIQSKITHEFIMKQLSLGASQPSPNKFHYPKTQRLVRATSESMLCFNVSWYERKLTDGSTQPRFWLSYSKLLNKAFCLYCMLFGTTVNTSGFTTTASNSSGGGGGGNTRISESWTKTGWDTWNNGSRDIKRHEESVLHRASELAKVRIMATGTISNGGTNGTLVSLPSQSNTSTTTATPTSTTSVLPSITSANQNRTADSVTNDSGPAKIPNSSANSNGSSTHHNSKVTSTSINTISNDLLDNRKAIKMLIDQLIVCCTYKPTESPSNMSSMYCHLVQIISQHNPQMMQALDRLRNQYDVDYLEYFTPRAIAQPKPGASESNIKSNNNSQLIDAIADILSERLAKQIFRRRCFILIVDMLEMNAGSICCLLWVRYLSNESPGRIRIHQNLLDVLSVIQSDNIAQKIQSVLHKYGLDEANMATFCCHSQSANYFILNLGAINVWPPPCSEILSLVLQSASNEPNCTSLIASLGFVQQLTSFWTVGCNIRQQYFRSCLSKSHQFTTEISGIDDILDLLVDRYEEMIEIFDQLCTGSPPIKLTASDQWLVRNFSSNLRQNSTRLAVVFLRNLIGILRPAFTCHHQFDKTQLVERMRLNIQQEYINITEEYQNSVDCLETSPPIKKCKSASTTTEDNQQHDLLREKVYFLGKVKDFIGAVYSDEHIQLLHEISMFTSVKLCSKTTKVPNNTASRLHNDSSSGVHPITDKSITTLCNMTHIDPRSLLREYSDFQPIYMQHRASSGDTVAPGVSGNTTKHSNLGRFVDNYSEASANSTTNGPFNILGLNTIPICPLFQITADDSTTDHQSPQSSQDDPDLLASISDPTTFLQPLELICEFTSFPNLLSLYKMLALLPIFPPDSSWVIQRQRVHQRIATHLRQSSSSSSSSNIPSNLDNFTRCALLLTSLTSTTTSNISSPNNTNPFIIDIPLDPILDKLFNISPGLKKCLAIHK